MRDGYGALRLFLQGWPHDWPNPSLDLWRTQKKSRKSLNLPSDTHYQLLAEGLEVSFSRDSSRSPRRWA
jgi:hypothetical protein